MDDETLLRELAPAAERLLERHLTTAREWMPHDYVPWSLGRDYEPDYEWVESVDSPAPAVRSALFVNLLTEDNLPYYSSTIDRMFGVDHPWREWTRRWTAEEMRHAMVIRDYVVVTRCIDPIGLERARMAQVSLGEVPEPPTAAAGMVYVTLQELATRIAHRNTGKHLAEPKGYDLLARVAADENLHHLFYRDLTNAAIEVDASTVVEAMADEVIHFEMPGTGIPDFNAHARVIAKAGIYDLGMLLDQVLMPVVKNHWRLEHLQGLRPEAEMARERIVRHLARLAKVVARQRDRDAEAAAKAEEAGRSPVEAVTV
ncbi:MAG: acyl-ACP desaturase [Acidimicrobiia bacterium]